MHELFARMTAKRRFGYRFLRVLLGAIALISLFDCLLIILVRPSNERDWSLDQAGLAHAEFSKDKVQIQNVRNAVYRSSADFDVHWETRSYDLSQVETLWFLVEPFSDWRGPAHTFLSFGFADGKYLGVSVEIRKEKGEAFSPFLGLFRQYELIYVLADERDLITLRAKYRNDPVFLYKMRATPEKIRALLHSMLARANQLAVQPEFYHTLNNTCTSNIVDHIDMIAPGRIPFSYKTLLPAYSDDLSFDLGLIDTKLDREHYRAAHQINALVLLYADSPDFSNAIRGQNRRINTPAK